MKSWRVTKTTGAHEGGHMKEKSQKRKKNSGKKDKRGASQNEDTRTKTSW